MTWVWDIKDERSHARAIKHVTDLERTNDERYQLVCKPILKRRTLAQNALYWQWVGEVAEYVSEATGYERDEIHEYFKQRFLPGIAPGKVGKEVLIDNFSVVRWTTTGLSTKEMADYTDRIFRWATTDLGLTLTLPPTAERRG